MIAIANLLLSANERVLKVDRYSKDTDKQGRFYGGPGGRPPMKNVPPVTPRFGPASLDFHLNRPVISLIQLHIVPPALQLELWPPDTLPHLANARTAPADKSRKFVQKI